MASCRIKALGPAGNRWRREQRSLENRLPIELLLALGGPGGVEEEIYQVVDFHVSQNKDKHTSIFSSFLVTSRSPAIVCSIFFFSNAPVYRTPSKQPRETQSTNAINSLQRDSSAAGRGTSLTHLGN